MGLVTGGAGGTGISTQIGNTAVGAFNQSGNGNGGDSGGKSGALALQVSGLPVVTAPTPRLITSLSDLPTRVATVTAAPVTMEATAAPVALAAINQIITLVNAGGMMVLKAAVAQVETAPIPKLATSP